MFELNQQKPTTRRFGRVSVVAGMVIALLNVTPMLSSVASAQNISQTPARPSAVLIPDVDPLAFAASEALEQLKIDLIRHGGGAETSVTYVRLRREAARIAARHIEHRPAGAEQHAATRDRCEPIRRAQQRRLA